MLPAIAAAGIGATGLVGCSGGDGTAGHDTNKAEKAGKVAEQGATSRDASAKSSDQGGGAALNGKRMWVPGIRIRQDQVQYSTLPNCPD
ncbi:hypothetical protein V2J94_32520 [Streptomyces sp. DSM 41524]|uniref:Lipoprotein n=1 Tax=Streptomyces asiaticus subsp. ignotus TaxID=3098222 RepID=A0ABU7Q5M7_9ACTN|nr:hypothetical protein [Streptomyces sp. DSM 41524]